MITIFWLFILLCSSCYCESTWDSFEISSDFQSGIPSALNSITIGSNNSSIPPPSQPEKTEPEFNFSLSDQSLKTTWNHAEQSDDYNDSDLIVIPDPMAVESLLKPIDDKAFSVSPSFMQGKPTGSDDIIKPKPLMDEKLKSNQIKINNRKLSTTIKPLVTSKPNLIKFNSKDRVEKISSKQQTIIKSVSTRPSTINKTVNNKVNQRSSLIGQSSIGNNNLKVNQPIKRTSFGTIGSPIKLSSQLRQIKNDKLFDRKKTQKPINDIKSNRRMLGPLRLMSQESYLSPTAQFSPFSPSSGQLTNQLVQTNQLPISLLSPLSTAPIQSPTVSLFNSFASSPSSSTNGLNQLNFLQSNPGLQTNQFTGSTSTVNLISPVGNIQPIGQLSSPGTVQTINVPSSTTLLTTGPSLTTNQGLISSPTFQQSPIQQLQSPSPTLIQVQTPNIQSSPNVQTFPVIQSLPLIQSSPGLLSPLKVTKTQAFESHIVKPSIALTSPTLVTNPVITSNLGSSSGYGTSLRTGGYLRTPIGLRSQLSRATSYFNPSLPTRSRTVLTQTQLIPTHTTVYTTTQFSPATRTTVYETDHVPIYGSTDSGLTTKSTKYGSSISSLSKYGTSFY